MPAKDWYPRMLLSLAALRKGLRRRNAKEEEIMQGWKLTTGPGRWLRYLGNSLLLLALACLHSVQAAETTTYVLTDMQGTVLAKEDAHGQIIARYDYRPYGKQQTGPTTAGPGYTGHVNDPDTGLVYMQQRYYDPIGRMLSVDPIKPTPGNVYSFNRYAYANNNPIINIDPDGQNATAFIGGLFVETAHFVTGRGFNGSAVVGALEDGYNGEGGGVLSAALQDAGTLTAAAGVAGVVKGGAALIAARFAAKEVVQEGVDIGATKGLGNPFKEKAAAEVEQMFKGKGFEPRGDPAIGKGGYVNPKTGRSYHIDPKTQGKYREPNHVDANRPRGYKGPLEKKKLPYKDD